MAAALTSTFELYARARAHVPVKVRLVGGAIRRRNPVATTVFVGLTAGLFGIVWLFLISRELKKTTGNPRLHPFLDLFLMLATGGLYGLVVLHRHACYIHAVSMYFNRSHVDRSRDVLVSAFGALVSFGVLGLGGVYLVQKQMNELARLAELRSAERDRRDRTSDRCVAVGVVTPVD